MKTISGSSMKVIAITTMLIDHIASHILRGIEWATDPFFVFWGHDIHWYLVLRSIGRIAFPIFAFLITEGYQHTHNRRNYGRTLLLFALLSEIPWNLVHADSLFCRSQNVFSPCFLAMLPFVPTSDIRITPSSWASTWL